MRIGIIGTGVAGSLLVDSLAEDPRFSVMAFERASADAQADAGTALNLGPNAMRALRLHRPARHADLRGASLPWRRWWTGLADGTPLFDWDLLDLADEAGVRLRWAALYAVLRAPIAAATRHGHALQAIEQDAAGRLVPVFETPAGLCRYGGFDLLVGADGRYSRARALTAGEPAATLLGVCIWRLLVPEADDCPFDEYGQWFNGNARMLAYPLPDGAAYVTGTFALPADGELPAPLRTVAAQRALFTPPDRPACAAVAWMLDRMELRFDDIHWARSQTVPLLRHAADGRVLLLGDAAQAMVPTLGQGATQAVECGVLAGAVLRAGGDAAAVAALRDPRVTFVRELSEAASDTLLPPCDPVAGARAKEAPAFQAKLRRLWTDVPASV